jgi:hypothetical protein
MSNLTTKELSGIEDQLKAEQNLISKLNYFSSCTQDSSLKSKYKEMSVKHQQHFDRLFSLLG